MGTRRNSGFPTMGRWGAAAAAAALATLAACGGVKGEYIWADMYRQPPGPGEAGYVISPGDVINIRVWNQDNVSGRVRVRNDGMISLALLNDVEAAGLTPPVLASRLQVRLKEFIVNPVVTVLLEEAAPIQVSLLGEVGRTGVYQMPRGSGVLQAIAMAGGLTESAGRDRIFVIRGVVAGKNPIPLRLRFNYDALARAEGRAATFRLLDGDVIVVE